VFQKELYASSRELPQRKARIHGGEKSSKEKGPTSTGIFGMPEVARIRYALRKEGERNCSDDPVHVSLVILVRSNL